MQLAACILAAGAGRRMGANKSDLELSGRSFAALLLETYATAGVAPLYVVARDVTPALGATCLENGAHLLLNPDPERGMLSSLHVCLDALGNRVVDPDLAASRAAGAPIDALFVNPVDCPRIRPETIASLARAYAATGAPIVVPCFDGRRGHPVLFAARLFGELRRAPLEVGARAVVWAHAKDRLEVEVDDASVLDDFDTPESLATVRRAAMRDGAGGRLGLAQRNR